MEIRSCPFCGEKMNKPNFITTQGYKWGAINCPSCNAYGPEVRTNYKHPEDGWGEDAIIEWNKRLGD